MNVTYFGALIAGFLSFLSPCVLPLVPPYLCFLGGTTFDQLAGEDETPSHVYSTVIMSSFAFVLGFVPLVFAAASADSAASPATIGSLAISTPNSADRSSSASTRDRVGALRPSGSSFATPAISSP